MIKPSTLPPFIESLRDQALKVGNNSTGYYIACICGMWAHVLKVKENVFDKSTPHLLSWYATGFTASIECVSMKQRMKS